MHTVLLVEDTLTDREVVTQCLRRSGLNVMTATSCEDALDQLQRQRPDVILLDVVLPGQSGFEFCRTLKDEPKTSAIPIVIYSTKDTDLDKFWGMRQGADAYLSKPIDQEELVRTVKQVIKR